MDTNSNTKNKSNKKFNIKKSKFFKLIINSYIIVKEMGEMEEMGEKKKK